MNTHCVCMLIETIVNYYRGVIIPKNKIHTMFSFAVFSEYVNSTKCLPFLINDNTCSLHKIVNIYMLTFVGINKTNKTLPCDICVHFLCNRFIVFVLLIIGTSYNYYIGCFSKGYKNFGVGSLINFKEVDIYISERENWNMFSHKS